MVLFETEPGTHSDFERRPVVRFFTVFLPCGQAGPSTRAPCAKSDVKRPFSHLTVSLSSRFPGFVKGPKRRSVSAYLPDQKNPGFVKGCKGKSGLRQRVQKAPKTATNYAFFPRSACNCPLPINPATDASIRHTTVHPGAGTHGSQAPAPPPGAAVIPPSGTRRQHASAHPCSLTSILGVSALLCPHASAASAIPHTSLARTMPFREMRTPSPPSLIAPFPRTPKPSPLRHAPRRTNLICSTYATALTRGSRACRLTPCSCRQAFPPSSCCTSSTQT